MRVMPCGIFQKLKAKRSAAAAVGLIYCGFQHTGVAVTG